jgi:tight adherence protein C
LRYRGEKMALLIGTLVFITAFTLYFVSLNLIYSNKIQILSRLEKIKERVQKQENKETHELEAPFYDRVIRPIGNKISDIINKITPKGMKKRIEEHLIMAGRPLNISVNQWFALKFFISGVIPVISIIYLAIINRLSFKLLFVLGVFAVIVNLLPDLIIKQIIRNRQKLIENSLPDVLDLLTVSVEAGLSFDGALGRLVDNMPGVLASEFGRVLSEMRMGKSRRDALKDMSIRCGVPDLTTLVGALIQADELGVSISNVLRVQSAQMRIKRRQRAQEKAMKAPIKMLFPLVLFIFPTIFAVLLGPAVIRIINVFSK